MKPDKLVVSGLDLIQDVKMPSELSSQTNRQARSINIGVMFMLGNSLETVMFYSFVLSLDG